MVELILSFFENFGAIAFVVAIVCFIIPMVRSLIKRKKRKIKRDVLDKETIMIDSGIYDNVGLNLFHLIFFIVGLIVIYAAINTAENNSTMIGGTIFGIIICIYPIIAIFKSIKTAIIVKNSKYVIVLDELMDKYYYHDHSYNGEDVDHSGWQLYFKEFFKKYDKYIKFGDLKEGNKYKIGDKFYLVFVKWQSIPYMFAANEYTLAQSEKDKLKTIDEVKDYIKLEEFILEKEISNKKIIINKKRIIKDFFDKSQKQTVVFLTLATLFLLFLGVNICINYFNLGAVITIVLAFLCLLIFTIIKIKYLVQIITNVKKDKYEIKEDEIVSLNNGIQYSDSNKMISFKFKNYKKIVYADKKYYDNPKIGDKFYLVFVKGDKEPIKVYDANYSLLEK